MSFQKRGAIRRLLRRPNHAAGLDTNDVNHTKEEQ
jgi:hypothetical protein